MEELRMTSPVTGKKIEDWAMNFMMVNKIIAISTAKIADRAKMLKLFWELNSKCKLGNPSIDEKGRLCVDFESEKHKTAFILKYAHNSAWLPQN